MPNLLKKTLQMESMTHVVNSLHTLSNRQAEIMRM